MIGEALHSVIAVMPLKRHTLRNILVAVMLLALAASAVLVYRARQAAPGRGYTKYSESFFGAFDTLTTIVAYAKSEAEFKKYYDLAESRFRELHKLYDIYNSYPGVANLKTINDNAGVRPVQVDPRIIDMIEFARDWYERTGGSANIAMGAVLRIWHDYRERGRDFPEEAEIPPMKDLRAAAEHTDLSKVIVDREQGTVYLADPLMSLDVGAVAKGYATELVVRELMEAGMVSGMVSAGGNVRSVGTPLDGIRGRWGVGIQDPDESVISDDALLDVVFVNDSSVVSSGDYERYYVVGDMVLHHLIDPVTLMPATHYKAITVVTEDSGMADFLSTALYLIPYDESAELASSLPGVEALWVMPDREVRVTEGLAPLLKSNGATGAIKK